MKNFFFRLKSGLEQYIPMTLGNFLVFAFLIYLVFIVGQSVLSNYRSNQEIAKEGEKLIDLENQVKTLQNQINYYQTTSFKEKEAREKLGYKAPGENVIALPVDSVDDKTPDSGLTEQTIKIPNYELWWRYFFGK